MWVESGHLTEESKLNASIFSAKSKWRKSTVSCALSIEQLTLTAWEEIEAGALRFVKHARQLVPSGVKEDPCACLMNCNSIDDNVGRLWCDNDLRVHNPNQPKSNLQQCAYNESIPLSPVTMSQIPSTNHHATGPQPVLMHSALLPRSPL